MKGWRPTLAAVCLFLLLTVVFTWPVVRQLDTKIAGEPGDSLYFVWLIEWCERAVFELHQSPIFDPWMNYPEGWSLASTQLPLSMVGLALPASAVAGAVAGYNFAALASFFLSALVVFVFVKRWTGRYLPAILAGAIFGFAPYRQSHFLIGHLDLLGTFWPALYILSLIDICIGRGLSRKVAWLLPIFLVATALTSPYYIYMNLLLSIPIVGASWLSGRLRGPGARQARSNLMVGLGAAMPLVILAIWPYVELRQTGVIGERSREYVRGYSASPTDYVIPATTSVAWGPWVSSHFDRYQWVEGTLYLGAVGAGLAVVALVRRRRLGGRLADLVMVCIAFGGTAFILSLGTDLNWLSKPVLVSVPGFARAWHPGAEASVPLPGRLFFEYLPLYSSMRVPMRFGVYMILAVSLLGSFGAEHLLASLSRPVHRLAVGSLLVLLVVVDFLPKSAPMFEVRARAVDTWLRGQPGMGAVAQFPFDLSEDQYHIYYTSVHRKPFLGGMFNAFPPAQYQRIRPILSGFPNEESALVLKELGVQYVLVSGPSYLDFPDVEAEILGLGLCPEVVLEGEHVYTWCDEGLHGSEP